MPSRRGAFWPLTRVHDDGDSIMCLKVRLTRRVWLAKLFAFSPEQGAETIVYLASSPAVAETTGEYFYQRQAIPPSPAAQDDRAADAGPLVKRRKRLKLVSWCSSVRPAVGRARFVAPATQ